MGSGQQRVVILSSTSSRSSKRDGSVFLFFCVGPSFAIGFVFSFPRTFSLGSFFFKFFVLLRDVEL